MLGMRPFVSISDSLPFGTRSLPSCRVRASSRVRRSTSDMDSPKLLRRARRRLPAVWGVVGIVGRSYHRGRWRGIVANVPETAQASISSAPPDVQSAYGAICPLS
jgi:hypothetical protein